MKSCHQRCLASLLFLFIFSSLYAQDQRAFNQTASGTNHGLSISFSPVYSIATNSSNDSLLFRGSGAGFRFGADYFFGKAGISFSSGFGSSSPDDATINNFLKKFPVPADQLTVTKARQQNMYMLLGPSVRFGNTVELYAHAKGGLFINNSGLVSIQQKGAQRAAYRNESTAKSIYPGFLTGMGIQYKTKSDAWSFGIGMDYMNTKSEVNNYDARRGGGIEALKLSRNITDLVTGIIVRYNILSPRDHASGQATGKRVLPTVNKREIVSSRDAASGLATGRRTYQPGQPVYGNITREESTGENCGMVTQRTTSSDGTTEEMTFACPDDAANYNSRMNNNGGMPNRISMNVTVPKQTQGATFGEKVNQGLHAAGSALSQGASLIGSPGVISGRVSWSLGASNPTGIVTNESAAVSSVGNLAGGSGGGAAAASYARSMNTSTGSQGIVSTIYAREAGSGQATGRRQYKPVFNEEGAATCIDCAVTVKLVAHELTHVVQQGSVKNNPLYSDNGQQGTNPMFEQKSRTNTNDQDCDGVAGLDVYLLDVNSMTVIARTKTETCGDFFFANVPATTYIVKVSGSIKTTKEYYVTINQGGKYNVAGEMMGSDDQWIVQINSSMDNSGNQKASINTTRSNIKRVTFIKADTDGDGSLESFRAIGTFSDGSSRDLSSKAGNNGNTVTLPVDNSYARTAKLSANLVGLNLSDKLTVTATYSDGTTRDVTADAKLSPHPNVVQLSIDLTDADGDGFADAVIKTKTKSNQSNDKVATGDGIWSPRSNMKRLPIATGDVNGDGISEMVVGNSFSWGASNSSSSRSADWSLGASNPTHSSNGGLANGKSSLLGGALPGGAVISAFVAGGPIGGIIVKGGKNPGGNLRTAQTNEYGEFEFNDWGKGSYTISAEVNFYINDETVVTVGDDDNDGLNERKGWDGTVKGGSKTKAQDHNSSRSNKSGIADNDIDNEDAADNAARKGWDGTVKGKIISSNDKGTIALEANQPITFRWTPLVPKPKEPVTYRIKVWQLMQGQNSTQARQANLPIVEKTVTNASEATIAGIYTGPCKPPYLCDFIWSVQAINKEGNPEGKTEEGSFNAEQAQTKIQNNSRSNKSGIADNDIDNEDAADNAARKGWDGTVKGKIISSSDKGAIALEANQPVTFRWTPLVPKPKEPVTYRIKVWQLMQGQNGSQARQANQPIVEKTVTSVSETTVAGIYTGPCKPPYLCDFIWSVQAINKEGNPEGKTEEGSFSAEQAQTKIQNNNTVRSNRTELKSILIEADLDGDGEFETDVTSKVSDEIKPNDETGAAQQKAGISTSRSNIRNRSALVDKGDDLYIGYGTTVINGKETSLKILYSAKQGKTGSAR